VTSDVTHVSLVVQEGGGGSVRVVLSGEFDILVVHDLDAVLCEAAAGLEPGGRLTVDMTGVTFLDAGSSAILMRVYYRLQDRNSDMQVVGARRQVAKVLTILGLGALITSDSRF